MAKAFLKYGCGLICIILLAFSFQGNAQVVAKPSSSMGDSSELIHLIHADTLMGIQPQGKDSAQMQKLIGHVVLRQGQTIFTCDSALQNLSANTIDAFGHIHINQADTINTFADLLHYEGNTKIATLKNNVRMTDGHMVLTTDLLNYDMNTHIGSYTDGGKLVNQSTVLTSGHGYYYADTKDVYFKNNVQLTDPQYTLATDTLLYNTISRIATFIAPTTINTGNSIIHTDCGYYNTMQNYAHLCDRPSILDSAQQVTADSMNYDRATGIGTAFGNVVWTDTSRKMTVLANYAVSNQVKNTILATKKPLLIIERQTDTLYVAMDTLFSGPLKPPSDTTAGSVSVSGGEKTNVSKKRVVHAERHQSSVGVDSPGNNHIASGNKEETEKHRPVKTDEADTSFSRTKTEPDRDTLVSLSHDTTHTKMDSSQLRYIIAYHHVRLFSDSLQGVSDSLYYSDLDSAFHFYKDPVLWTGASQLTGDTIVLFTKDQQASKIVLKNQALIINKLEDSIYNQVKGKIITGYFGDENQLVWMDVNGNAESMYYAQDNGGAFVGGNHSTSARIHLYFNKGKLNKVVFLKDVDGTFMPPTKIPEEDKMLQGFRWEPGRRPKSKTELME